MKQKGKTLWQVVVLLSFVLNFSSCKDDKNEDAKLPFNPSEKIEISGFNPESAGGGANFFIYGKNFGTDASIINVTVNDKEAVVISADGTTIYCMVPTNAGTGHVKVTIGTEVSGTQEAISEKEFQYQGALRVGTLLGWVDRDNNSSTTNGSFEKAQFQEPAWLCFGETTDEIYVTQQTTAIRKIDMKNRIVETLFPRTGGVTNGARTLAFSTQYDTLYVSNDQDNKEEAAVSYALKRESYKQVRKLISGRKCNGADIHPVHGDLFYNCYDGGELYRWDRETQTSDFLFRAGDIMWEYYVQFEPDGNFAYLVSRNKHYILKSFYDWKTHRLAPPSVFVGSRDKAGYTDGVGTAAQFRGPNQGCFDKNKNFYICDVDNHCIRKITPDGIVTTFAGRPGQGGYADGDLRNQAQFRYPVGILYDEEKDIFYISDCMNHRIRTIKAE